MPVFDRKFLSGKNQGMILDRMHGIVLAKNEKNCSTHSQTAGGGYGNFEIVFFREAPNGHSTI